jgi:hypothetical protein
MTIAILQNISPAFLRALFVFFVTFVVRFTLVSLGP